jgi:NitT/TauT family transport system substrate-binding protein
MQHVSTEKINRREFLRICEAAAAAGLFASAGPAAALEPPPEVTKLRLIRETEFPILCYAPQYLAEELLKAEGFTEIEYVPKGVVGSEAVALIEDKADISAALCVDWIFPIAQGEPVTVLCGLHAGCIEVFAGQHIRNILDLKGRRLAVHGLGSPERYLLASIVSYIGLNPKTDIEWVFAGPNDWPEMLARGDVDAIMSFPPSNYDLRDRNIGHVILNTTIDNPWRHYLCCMVGARSEFVTQYPVATKRAMRAILKANQFCAQNPERAAEMLVLNGQASSPKHALQTLLDIPYDAWRDFDPVDSLTFYSLRLREAGLIDDTPQHIIELGTEWKFFNELKNELKA